MKIGLSVLLIALFAGASTVPSSAAADRYALVIGNAAYPDAGPPLKEPVNDARDVADELKRDGFNVELGENLNGEAMRRALDRLYSKLRPGSAALLFFSGFGIQSDRRSYLIPIDAQLWTEPDVRRDGFNLETILTEMNNRGAAVKIALIDASRRNPYERRFRTFSAGLLPVSAPNGTIVMYSAANSSVVPDSGGDHSLFVQELLREIRVPNLSAEETLNRTRVGVTRASRSEQVPSISSSMADDDFSFIPGALSSNHPPAPPPVANNPPPRPGPAPPPPPVAAAPPPPPPPASPPPQLADTSPTLPPPRVEIPPPPPPRVEIPPPPPPVEQPSSNSTQVALADDPTIKTLTAKLDSNPDDVSALYRRGQVYASKGAYSLAIKDFDGTLRINPKDVEALNNRCWARAVVGDLQAALKDCNEALRLRPNFVDALDSRGLVNLKSGMTKNAITDFDAALKINPRLTSSLYGRGLAKKQNGSISEGNLDIANAKAMDPNIVQEFESYGVR